MPLTSMKPMHKLQFINGFTDIENNQPALGEPIPFIQSQYKMMKTGVMKMIQIFGSQNRADELSNI